jgi:UDP:flavonoid glycosyltransferase YjiC (YdhE family)
VFAYLKRFAELPNVLHALADAGHATLVYAEGVGPNLRRRFESPSLRFADLPVDLNRVGREWVAAVLNGGHGVTAEMLLAGKPIVQIPLALEQRLTADATKRLGAGDAASARSVDAVGAALERVLADQGYAAAAACIARRYASFDPEKQRSAMVRRAEALLAPCVARDGERIAAVGASR